MAILAVFDGRESAADACMRLGCIGCNVIPGRRGKKTELVIDVSLSSKNTQKLQKVIETIVVKYKGLIIR